MFVFFQKKACLKTALFTLASILFTGLLAVSCDFQSGIPTLTGTVTINNTSPEVGDTLIAAYENGNGSGDAVWTWLRDDVVISGEYSDTYEVKADDLNKTLKARVSFADQSGHIDSAATAAVVDSTKPALTGTVIIDNTSPEMGDTLTASYEDGNGSGAVIWVWLHDDVVISGQHTETYHVVDADWGKTLKARVSFADQSGHIDSAATDPVTDDSITIATAQDLAKIGADDEYQLSGTYRLTDNITLSDWTPIGTTALPFTGVFNGNGKTITLQSFTSPSGNPALAGIFGQITGTTDDKAQVKNLTIHADSVNQTSIANLQIGLLAGNATYADISNITVTGSLSCGSSVGTAPPANTRLGGIVGVITSSSIENSTSNVAITVTGIIQTGGIAGSAGGTTAASAVIISNCENNGAIARDGPGADAMTGGIAGSFSGLGSVIEYCKGTGNITITGGTTTNTFPNSAYTGGLVGQVASNGKIEKSFSSCNVSFDGGSATFVGIGGIAGRTQSATGDIGMTIQDCYATGNIQGKTTVTATAGGGVYAGGIVGLINAGLINAPVTTTVSRCYATGAVTAERSGDPSVAGTAPGVNPGGIVGGPYGNANVKAQIQNCVALNTGIKAIYALRPPNISRIANTITTNAATPAVYAPEMTNNKAWSGMSLTTMKIDETEEAVASGDMLKGLNANDGEDCVQRPAQSDYTGWDFTNIWQMTGNLPTLRGF